jgi:hypothetical protein
MTACSLQPTVISELLLLGYFSGYDWVGIGIQDLKLLSFEKCIEQTHFST